MHLKDIPLYLLVIWWEHSLGQWERKTTRTEGGGAHIWGGKDDFFVAGRRKGDNFDSGPLGCGLVVILVVSIRNWTIDKAGFFREKKSK